MNDEPLSKDRAKARLNSCVEEGSIIYTRHFREELINDGLTREDILVVVRSGAVIMEPERDIKTGQWKYRIEGTTVERRQIAVVFAFLTQAAVLITVFERV